MAEHRLRLQVSHLSYSYQQGEQSIPVLQNIDFTLLEKESLAILGPSGVGKSTLLNLIGLLDYPKAGRIRFSFPPYTQVIEGHVLKEEERCILRRKHIGIVYQSHYLLEEFTALENVMVALTINHHEKPRHRAEALLDAVGLAHRFHHKPSQLSGGQQQRVAIARALANAPDLLLADEPTGNLDQATAHDVFMLFQKIVADCGTSVIMTTHQEPLAYRMDRQLILQGGKLSPYAEKSHA